MISNATKKEMNVKVLGFVRGYWDNKGDQGYDCKGWPKGCWPILRSLCALHNSEW